MIHKPYPWIMGILNVTPDSFSDGGRFISVDKALEQVERLVASGADLIDIGGESSRPGAHAVSEAQERRRVVPLVRAVRRRFDVPLSIDTVKASVAGEALEAGANWINDISALSHDPRMAAVVAQAGVPVVLMHRRGTARGHYADFKGQHLVEEVQQFFAERVAFALTSGIAERNLVLDPGIGFGKHALQNCELINRLGAFKALGLPLLVGSSRKSFIGKLTGHSVEARLPGTLASTLLAVLRGADIVRVHDVGEVKQALVVWQRIVQRPH